MLQRNKELFRHCVITVTKIWQNLNFQKKARIGYCRSAFKYSVVIWYLTLIQHNPKRICVILCLLLSPGLRKKSGLFSIDIYRRTGFDFKISFEVGIYFCPFDVTTTPASVSFVSLSTTNPFTIFELVVVFTVAGFISGEQFLLPIGSLSFQ